MKIQCTTGERAVHLSLSYDDAEALIADLKISPSPATANEAQRLQSQIAQARKRGLPKPPLKKEAPR